MNAQILLDMAKKASEKFMNDDNSRLAFRVGYLETTIKELCSLLDDSEKIMHLQRDLIDQMKKGISANL
jgi:hypothetical protein